jgi:hypothetical protein
MGQLGYALTGGLQGYGQGLQYQNEQKWQKRQQDREDADLSIRRGSEDRANKAQRLQAAQAMLADANAEMQRPDWDGRSDAEQAVVRARADKARAAISQAGGLMGEAPAVPAPEAPPGSAPKGPIGNWQSGLNQKAPLGDMKLQAPQAPQQEAPPNFDTGQPQPHSAPDPAMLQQIAGLGIPALSGIHAPDISPQQVGGLMQETSPGFHMPQAPAPAPAQGPPPAPAPAPGTQHPEAPEGDILAHVGTLLAPMIDKVLPTLQNYASHGRMDLVMAQLGPLQQWVTNQAALELQHVNIEKEKAGLPFIAPEAQAQIAANLGQAAVAHVQATVGIPAEARYHDRMGQAALDNARAKGPARDLKTEIDLARLKLQQLELGHKMTQDDVVAGETARHNRAGEGHDQSTERLGFQGLGQRERLAGQAEQSAAQRQQEGILLNTISRSLVSKDILGQTTAQSNIPGKLAKGLHDYEVLTGQKADPSQVVPPGIHPSIWGAVVSDGFDFNRAAQQIQGSNDPNKKVALQQLKQAADIWNKNRAQFGR